MAKAANNQAQPEQVIDIYPLHSVERRFIDQFPDQPELQSLHCVMTFGLIARDCRISYVTRNPDLATSRHTDDGVNALQAFAELLSIMRTSGQVMRDEIEGDYYRAALWNDMYDAVHGLRPELNFNQFDRHLAWATEVQMNFLLPTRPTPSERNIERIRDVAHDIRTASELIVCDMLEAHDVDLLIENSSYLDKKVWADFSDEFYWDRNDAFRSFQDSTRYLEHMELIYNMREAHRATYADSLD